jgi:hypothetical protein
VNNYLHEPQKILIQVHCIVLCFIWICNDFNLQGHDSFCNYWCNNSKNSIKIAGISVERWGMKKISVCNVAGFIITLIRIVSSQQFPFRRCKNKIKRNILKIEDEEEEEFAKIYINLYSFSSNKINVNILIL